MALFSPEKLELINWSERTSLPDGVHFFWQHLKDTDDALAKMEECLQASEIGGTGFSSKIDSEAAPLLAEYQGLIEYVNYLPYDIEDLIDQPFYLQVNNEALEQIATIDATKISTNNTIGLEGSYSVHGGGQSYSGTSKVASLTFNDFLGVQYSETGSNQYANTTHNQSVASFANIFKQQYDALDEEYKKEISYEDYAGSLLPEEFSVEKDVSIWLDLAGTLLDLTIIVPLIEAGIGKEFLTGDHLTDREGTMKALSALAQLIATVVTFGGSLVGGAALKDAAKILVAALISDAISNVTFTLSAEMGLPPILCTLLAIMAGIAAGKLASDFLLNGKVGGKIPLDEYSEARTNSINNPDSDVLMLGKFNADGVSYVTEAGDSYRYFDMGDDWGYTQKRYNLTDNEMFDLFNKPFLDDAIEDGLTIKFSHNPYDYDGFLRQEIDYLINECNYIYDASTMTAYPRT